MADPRHPPVEVTPPPPLSFDIMSCERGGTTYNFGAKGDLIEKGA